MNIVRTVGEHYCYYETVSDKAFNRLEEGSVINTNDVIARYDSLIDLINAARQTTTPIRVIEYIEL